MRSICPHSGGGYGHGGHECRGTGRVRLLFVSDLDISIFVLTLWLNYIRFGYIRPCVDAGARAHEGLGLRAVKGWAAALIGAQRRGFSRPIDKVRFICYACLRG